jgi:pilus assembly protein FimV
MEDETDSAGSSDGWKLALGGAAAALVAIGGLLMWRRRQSKRSSDSGETSFIESRLPQDSFFGASGGQRIDTRDGETAASSMNYSLSQLDAIGDVDPVAEADVYLAYGRDLQAEEILKEAMRSNPSRMAIRTKLLEVYAKRRDTRAFESLAREMHEATGGEGEDWVKARDMGLHIDPENALYQDPSAVVAEESEATSESAELPASLYDIDSTEAPVSEPGLDLDLGGTQSEPISTDASPTMDPGGQDISLDIPELALETIGVPSLEMPSDDKAPEVPSFDLSGISLDLDAPAAADDEADTLSPEAADLAEDDGSNPLQRKLDLAEEFRHIGDLEGARDLLNEVIANSEGSLKAKAQNMLDNLA